jgi:hypothetical protein
MTRNLKPDDQPRCADPAYDPDIWFPEPTGRAEIGKQLHLKKAMSDAVLAMSVCATCPLQAACVEYAMESLETIHYGIYGGTLPYERQAAVGAGDVSNTITWQGKIRKMADDKGIIVPYIAKRERPELLVSLQERASWRALSWDSQEQAS